MCAGERRRSSRRLHSFRAGPREPRSSTARWWSTNLQSLLRSGWAAAARSRWWGLIIHRYDRREGWAADLTAYRYGFPDDSADRVIIRRDRNVAGSSTLPALNIAAGSAEAVKTDTAKTLLTGLIAQEIPTFGLAYLTGAACEPNLFKIWASVVPGIATDSILLPGVPASIQRATDFTNS